MKKLSEVCEIVGVTRRTLQEYDKVGLLHPSDKTEDGYWLYDENAIKQLIAIQVFIECGYERKKIKSILEMPSLDLLSEFDKLIIALEEKRKRIDGSISFGLITLMFAEGCRSMMPKKSTHSFDTMTGRKNMYLIMDIG